MRDDAQWPGPLERAAKKWKPVFAVRALYTLKPISFSAFERFRPNAG
jgi:hypothetical protein